MLAETIASVLAGKFGDLFGCKRPFQISAAIVAGAWRTWLRGRLPDLDSGDDLDSALQRLAVRYVDNRTPAMVGSR